jgi:uncharacterized protein YfaP (DUF2135 family)
MHNMKRSHIFTFVPLGILAVVFVISRFYPMLSHVPIKVVSLKNGDSMPEGVITLTGTANKATNIYINGKNTPVTKSGEFEEPLVLPNGYNIVTITAKNKFGKTSEKTLTLHVLDNESGKTVSLINTVTNN